MPMHAMHMLLGRYDQCTAHMHVQEQQQDDWGPAANGGHDAVYSSNSSNSSNNTVGHDQGSRAGRETAADSERVRNRAAAAAQAAEAAPATAGAIMGSALALATVHEAAAAAVGGDHANPTNVRGTAGVGPGRLGRPRPGGPGHNDSGRTGGRPWPAC